MATAKKEELKVIPGFSRGVRDNTAVRMVKLARPICPFSKITIELDSSGNPVPVKEVKEPSCQLAGEGWVEMCEKKGHDPFFTTRRWYTTEDIIEQDDKGRFIKVGEQVFPHEVKIPNIAQVAVATRINNGQGARDAVLKKGFRLLKDIGYADVCEFRNCQAPVTAEGTSRKYGKYCGKNHLSLIAADREEVFLHQPNSALNGPETEKIAKARERALTEVLLGA